jgi:hypothetical protein
VAQLGAHAIKQRSVRRAVGTEIDFSAHPAHGCSCRAASGHDGFISLIAKAQRFGYTKIIKIIK